MSDFSSPRSEANRERTRTTESLGTVQDTESSRVFEVGRSNSTVNGCIITWKMQIEKSIYDLYRTDYRVRAHIARCLLEAQPRSSSIDFQTAFCYSLGFGMPRNDAKAEEILKHDPKAIDALRYKLSALHEEEGLVFQAEATLKLRNLGHILWKNFADIYISQGKAEEAEVRLQKETNDLVVACGDGHSLTMLSRDRLVSLYMTQRQLEKVEKLLVRQLEQSPGELYRMDTLGSMYYLQERFKEAEKLFLEIVEKRRFWPVNESLLGTMDKLARTYKA